MDYARVVIASLISADIKSKNEKKITAVSKTGQKIILKIPKNQRMQNKSRRNGVAIGAPEKLASSSASSTQLTC
jgi:hypothetical protein